VWLSRWGLHSDRQALAPQAPPAHSSRDRQTARSPNGAVRSAARDERAGTRSAQAGLSYDRHVIHYPAVAEPPRPRGPRSTEKSLWSRALFGQGVGCATGAAAAPQVSPVR
jgi:hypothetical protein